MAGRRDSRNSRDSRDNRKKKRPQNGKKRRKKRCFFCVEKKAIDYKDIALLRRFVTDRGKIAPMRMSGCCAYHQRNVARVVKRVRQMGLMPYMVD